MVWDVSKNHDCHGLMYESLYILSLKIIIFGVYTLAIQYTLIDSMIEMQARELFHVFCHPNNEQDVPSQSLTPTTTGPIWSLSFLPHVPPGARKEAALGPMHARSRTLHKPCVTTPNRLSRSIYILNQWFSNTWTVRITQVEFVKTESLAPALEGCISRPKIRSQNVSK